MFNSYSRGGNSSSSASAKVSNNISIKGVGGSEAASLYNELYEKVCGDIIGKAMLSIGTIDIAVFQIGGRDPLAFGRTYKFIYGFKLKAEHDSDFWKSIPSHHILISNEISIDIPHNVVDSKSIEEYTFKELIDNIGKDIALQFQPHIIKSFSELRFDI